jgi:NAD(P)-dependent dehydrogenase (short-subunit alcohol dehydrogenase family)
MKNKVILITGTNAGIGKSIVKTLEKEKCIIIATSRKKNNNKNRKNIYYHNLDVTKEDQWKEIMHYIKKQFGKLDVLINNAGVRISGDVENTSLKLWNDIININLTSMFIGCKYALPLLKKSKNASIVNLASITSIRGVKNMIAYSASKGAIVSFTASLALDLAKNGIRVNAVAPGAVDTKMVWSLKKEINSMKKFNQRMKEAHPIGRIATPQEIANVVIFLAGNESSFITGITLPVDGGRSIR